MGAGGLCFGPAPPSPGTIPSSDELLAWSRMSHRPLHADEDGIVAACEEAWVCCDAPGCGKWRRVPAAVARRVGGTAETTPTRDPNGVGDTSWRCADGRDVRYNACAAPQELENDDIDRRVAAAERRERKRAQDRAYRARKRARREAARAGLVLEEEGEGEGGEASFAYLERRDGPLVTVLDVVEIGEGKVSRGGPHLPLLASRACLPACLPSPVLLPLHSTARPLQR